MNEETGVRSGLKAEDFKVGDIVYFNLEGYREPKDRSYARIDRIEGEKIWSNHWTPILNDIDKQKETELWAGAEVCFLFKKTWKDVL